MLPWLSNICHWYGVHFLGILICGEKDDGVEPAWAAVGLWSSPQQHQEFLDMFAETGCAQCCARETSMGTGFGLTRMWGLQGNRRPCVNKNILTLPSLWVGQLFPLLHGSGGQATPAHRVGVFHPNYTLAQPRMLTPQLRFSLPCSSLPVTLALLAALCQSRESSGKQQAVLANGWAQVNEKPSCKPVWGGNRWPTWSLQCTENNSWDTTGKDSKDNSESIVNKKQGVMSVACDKQG